MKTFQISFTDIYGVEHPNAVAMIAAVSQQASVSIGEDGTERDGYAALNYQVRFWHTEALRVAGHPAQPYAANGPYMGASGAAGGVLQLVGEAALLPSSEWCEACRAHFETVVVPTLSPAESST